MIQKRNGTFETNSSSTHALCIQNKEVVKINNIYFGIQDFGDYDGYWSSIQERANYIHGCMACLSKTEYLNEKERITNELQERGIKTEWYSFKWNKEGIYEELDMKDCLIEETLKMIKDIDLMLKFIINEGSTIIAGYDELYDDYKNKYQEKHREGDDYKYVYYEY